jgi:hypothetical protein
MRIPIRILFRLRSHKSPFERLEIRFIVNFGQCPCFWIRIQSCCESRSRYKRAKSMRIHADLDTDPQHWI